MTISTLLTHVHPDLDAILSVHLLREHGGEKIAGVDSADLQFVSANQLPEGKTADELEQEGVLAVDTGGGRFDNHPVEGESNEDKWDSCASVLVAEGLDVASSKAYRFLLPYTLDHDSRGQALTSKNATHHLLAPHSLIDGLHRSYKNDGKVVEVLLPMLRGIAAASEGEELSLRETAENFDKAFAHFLSNSELPEAKHFRKASIEWEAEGESHSTARSRGWQLRRDLEKILRLISQMLAGSDDALPEVEQERRVILPAAINGFVKLYGVDSDELHKAVEPLFMAAVQRESDWFNAIDEVERSAKTIRGRGVQMVTIASKNGLAIKAARYRRGGNAVLYMEPTSRNTTLQSGQKPDGSPLLNLPRIVSRIRTAELVKRRGNGVRLPKDISEVGMVEDWFLHQSLRLINRGSPKAPEVEPSALSWKELIEVIATDLRPDQKMPDWFCPADKCLEKKCTFYGLRLINCSQHRKRLREVPQPGTLGDLFKDKLKKKGR